MFHPPFTSVRFVIVLTSLVVALLSPGSVQSTAQEQQRTFEETGKTVKGKFLIYWNTHGGLAQQGFPISEEMQERSDTDGKTYTVQYFERAVFEHHPENPAPNDVLLSLLGNFLYKQKYAAGAPNQKSNSSPGSMLFSETGKRLGGVFLSYWKENGGLAQQGFPISDEFSEVSPLNGKTYTVQYFERAVFELHPENQSPFNVLLSQLGTFRYRDKYLNPTATSAVPTVTALPSATPLPTGTPIPITSCDGIPESINISIDPVCAPLYTEFRITGLNFPSTEDRVGVYATTPSGKVFGAPFHVPVGGNGKTVQVLFLSHPEYLDDELPDLDPRDIYGVWTITMEGLRTHQKAYGYFKITPLLPPTPQP